MYHKLRCPHCHEINFFGSALGAGESWSSKCTSCKKAATWAGPSVEATLHDASPGVAIGTKDDAATLIAQSPQAVLLDKYSQGERIKTYSASDASVKEGVCNGQSLHWIRRVLQGGRVEYKVRESKLTVTRSPQAMEARRKGQHMGGAITQKATVPAELSKYSDAAYSEYSKAWKLLDDNWDAAERAYEKKMKDLGATKTADGWSYFVNEKTTAAIDEWETVQSFVKAEKAKLTLAKESREKAGSYKSHWEQIAKNLDARLAQASIAKKKRPFSGIVAIRHGNREKYGNGTPGFASKLFADTDFKVGSCALISVGLKIGIGEGGGSISGHASVVHYAKDNLFHIFDPNIGMFCSTSKGHAKSTLTRMIDDGWVKVFGWQLDGEFGATLFEAKQAAVEVAPKQVPVQYTVSPEATAVQNKTVIPASTKEPATFEKSTPVKKPVVQPPAKTPVASGPNTGGGGLKAKLQAAMNNPSKHRDKQAGKGTEDGLGYCLVDQDLCREVIAAKIAVGNAGLRGQSPMGDWIQKGTLRQLINMLH